MDTVKKGRDTSIGVGITSLFGFPFANLPQKQLRVVLMEGLEHDYSILSLNRQEILNLLLLKSCLVIY